MKLLLTILFFIFFISSFGQTPNFQTRSSGVVTTIDVRAGAKLNWYNAYHSTDTTLNGGLDTLGAQLHVRSGALQGLWYRDSVSTGGHRWLRITPTIENYWQLSGTDLWPVSDTYDIGIGGQPDHKFDVRDNNSRLFWEEGLLDFYDNSTLKNLMIGTLAGTTLTSTSSANNIAFGSEALRFGDGNNNVALGQRSLYENNGGANVAIGYQVFYLTDSTFNTGLGYNAGVQNYGKQNIVIGALSSNAKQIDTMLVDNTEITVATASISGSGVGTLISDNSLSVGIKYPIKIEFNGTAPSPYTTSGIIANATVTNSNTISLQNIAVFATQGSGTMTIRLYNKQDNAIAIGYGAQTDSSNQIVIGNSTNSILKSNQFVVDLTDVPATGEVLTWDGTKGIWDTIIGGGGGAYSFLSPLNESGGVVSIQNAVADGSTKGAASFTAADFNASSGNISIDYTNAQAASTTLKGFLTNTDWNTFNNKVSTGLITSSGLTISTATLAGRYSAGTGAIQEITLGSGLSLSGSGVLTASGSGGITTLNTLTAATQFLAIGSSGTSPSWSVSGGDTHSLNLPTTSGTNTGLVTPTLYNTWNAKQDAITGAATTIVSSNLTSNRALISSATGKVDVSSVTNTELGYVSGVTSAIQTQLNNKAPLVSKTFQALGLSGSDISWVYTSGYNATYTITADRDILVSADADGDYGTLIITQNGTGGWDLTVPNTDFLQDGINVVGEPFTIDLPDAANSVAIVSWVNHSGVRYWTFGYYHQ
jgi:hypothetical protein